MSGKNSELPTSLAMLHMVAKLHYEFDMAQVDIAKKIGVSTATVSRMIQRARTLGIVRIEVLDPAPADEIAGRLIAALGLRRAAVIEPPPTGVLGALAAPLGQLLREAGLGARSVVGIGWGRAVREVIAAGLPRLPGAQVVALNGGMQLAAPHFQINEFVRQAAEQMGGNATFVHAPYVSSAELRRALLSDAEVKQVVALWDRLDCAIVGVGLPHAINPPEASAASESEQAMGGAVGDVLRHYFDAEGTVLDWEHERQMIAASAEQLRRCPLSIAVAADVEKAPSIIAAARSRMISALVTDTTTAQAILALVPPSQHS